MEIHELNLDIKRRLRESGITKIMKSIESCDWVVIEEKEGKIIGAAGLGGLFHVSGIQILENHVGKGLGKILQNEFLKILTKIDVLYILDIYSAGEKSISNINSKNLVKKIKNKNTFYIKNPKNLKFLLKEYYNDENIIVFMGAGSITNFAHELVS